MLAFLIVLGILVACALALLGYRELTAGTGRRKIQQISVYGYAGTDQTAAPAQSRLEAAASAIGTAVARRSGDDSELRAMLTGAGWYGTSTRTFVGYQVLGAIAMAVLWAAVGTLSRVNPVVFVVGIPVAGLFGWRLPHIVLSRRVKDRHAAIDRALPELIDLLVVAVESGLGLAASLRLVSRDLDGPLAEELQLTLQEQAMGLSTTEALQGMQKRVDTVGMRSFVRGVVQGETLGLSIAQILRNVADEMRKRRTAFAQERAQKAPVKMLFPLVLLIFPAMFVVLLLPAIISIADALDGVR